MSKSYDISMSLNDTLELDTIVEESSKASNPINITYDGNSSYDSNILNGIQTHTSIFDPPEPGIFNFNINGQKLKIKVTDSNNIPDSAVAQFNSQSINGFSDGDNISNRPDQTDNENNATGSGTYRKSAINSYAAIEYDPLSSDEHTVGFSSNISQRITIFAVTKTNVTSTNELSGVVAAETNRSWFAEPAGQGEKGHNIDAGSSGTESSNTVDTNPSLLTAVFDGSNTELRINGTKIIGPTSLGSVSWDGFAVGSAPWRSNKDHYNGYIGFVEFHDGNPSNGMTTREQEIADMWDITL